MQPRSLEERLLHIKEAQRRYGMTIPWIADTMSNDLKHAFGDANNSEFIIDPDGRIAVMRDWSNPATLREDLARLVGPVKNPTDPASIELSIDRSRPAVARGVVDRVERPGGMQAVRVTAEAGRNPLYVKLRAEADRGLLQTGRGKLYLGFNIDPIHHVHWNNLNDPLHVEIEPPDGVTITPDTLDGPKPDAEADIDPREFVVDVRGANARDTIDFTVYYFACDDADTWCKPVRQSWSVSLQPDRDAGVVFSRSRARGGQGRSGRGGPGSGR